MLTFRETIRPSADLRNHYNEVSRQCRENKEAVIITVNALQLTDGVIPFRLPTKNITV